MKKLEFDTEKRLRNEDKKISRDIGIYIYQRICYKDLGEFLKISLIGEYDTEINSVIYPNEVTNLIWNGNLNIPKILCEAEEKTGIKYLSGCTAEKLDSKNHKRIEKRYIYAFGNCIPYMTEAYMMPDELLAKITMSKSRWLDFFEGDVNPEEILASKKIIMQPYTLYDEKTKMYWVYDLSTHTLETIE